MSYQHIRLPDSGEKISVKDGRLNIPDQPIIGYVEGDGIGPDITRASTLLGWGPRVPLTEGLEKTIRFFASTNQLPVQAMRLGAAFAPGTQSDPIVQI